MSWWHWPRTEPAGSAGCQEGTRRGQDGPEQLPGMSRKRRRCDRQGGQRLEATKGHQDGSWDVPKPCGSGHRQLPPPASLSTSQAGKTLSVCVSLGRLRDPGPFPSPRQKPGNKSLRDAGGISRPGGICLARGEVKRGEETAFQSVSPFENPSQPPQVSSAWPWYHCERTPSPLRPPPLLGRE